MPLVDLAPASSCAIDGYLTDTDPNGTNVRSAPRADAPVSGHLPLLAMHPADPADAGAPVFEIIGSKNGWLLIRNARFEDPADPVKPVFKGPGWISGGLVGFTVGSLALRDAPSANAKVIEKLTSADGTMGPDSYKVTHVHACVGHFAEVTIQSAGSHKSAPMRGWVDKVCGNQLTTCN